MANEIIVKDLPKNGQLETLNLYVMGAVVYYPVVHEPKPKYQSQEREFSIVVFVDEEAKDKLLDEVFINKTISEVGKGKTTRPPRRVKFPLSSQVEDGKAHYDAAEGLFGFSVARPEFSKKGNLMSVNVIDKDGQPFTENVGNGSVCNIKMFGYKNQDGQVTVMLDTVQVIEHVPYEGGDGSSGSVEDDVLGVSYKVKKVDTPAGEGQKEPTKSKPQVEDDFEEEQLPF